MTSVTVTHDLDIWMSSASHSLPRLTGSPETVQTKGSINKTAVDLNMTQNTRIPSNNLIYDAHEHFPSFTRYDLGLSKISNATFWSLEK